MKRVLITGGAGFVGSYLARRLREGADAPDVIVLDNLRRRGSEINVPKLKAAGAAFVHGDIRMASDLEDLPGDFDLMIEASAEPSVMAGINSSPLYVLNANLTGTMNCLEFARRRCGRTVFLSTSRVYSIAPLRAIAMEETDTRFEISARQVLRGMSEKGVSEDFPTDTARSLYGATKLASELLIQEYVAMYGMQAVINRCGVIAGPGQFGKVDQGVFTMWVAHHHFGRPLKYMGFGGQGKQVRDLMHPADLYDLLSLQLSAWEKASGQTFNAGGGRAVSVSLRELTEVCREVTGKQVSVGSDAATNDVDVPLYVTDSTRAAKAFGWAPRKSVRDIVAETAAWIRENEKELRPIFGA